jgi:two-component system OmpR family sensor kinase
VANDGPIVPGEALARLANRFERAATHAPGSGLGLAIVHAIAQRIGGALVLRSPRAGHASGFEATFTIPIDGRAGVGSDNRGATTEPPA